MTMSDTHKKNLREQFSDEIYAKTKKYQKKYGFEIGVGEHDTWNNEADAFKHAFMQAVLAQRFTSLISLILGRLHEWEGDKTNQPKAEKNMDLWNNKVGREIFNEVKWELMGKRKKDFPPEKIEQLYAQKIFERLQNGDLIANPND